MRRQHDAIMVGSGTVISDDPSLNVRDTGGMFAASKSYTKFQVSKLPEKSKFR